jgi:hypothetical protein
VFGEPACTWISAWNELAVTFSTANPTEVAASLTFVVQSPWAGLFVPNATFLPVAGTDVDGDADEVVVLVEVRGVVDVDVVAEGVVLELHPANATAQATRAAATPKPQEPLRSPCAMSPPDAPRHS